MSTEPDAVVVGAGIGGLAAAIALRRRGWRPLVLERAPALGDVGAGLSLWSNALAALDALGLGREIRRAGTMRRGGGFRRPDGRWLTRSSGAELQRRSGVELLMVHRADLHRMLRDALPGDDVRCGVTVSAVEQRGDHVAVHADGSELRARLVVGADGLHSTVRSHLHPDAPTVPAGFTAWRGVTDVAFDLGDEAAETWGRGGEFGAVTMTDGRVYWFGTANLPVPESSDDEHAAVRRRFGDWHDPIPRILDATAPGAVLRHDVRRHALPLPPVASHRVVLLGDAAHAITPNLGQGACLALEDAADLGARLAAHRDVPAALADHDRHRRPRTERLARESAQLGRMIQLEHPVAVALRDLLVGVAPSSVAARRLARTVAWTPPSVPVGRVAR